MATSIRESAVFNDPYQMHTMRGDVPPSNSANITREPELESFATDGRNVFLPQQLATQNVLCKSSNSMSKNIIEIPKRA